MLRMDPFLVFWAFDVDDTDFLLRGIHEFFEAFYVWSVGFHSSVGRDQLFSKHSLEPVPYFTDQSNIYLA